MRITVFGATGRTGRHVVEQALAAGHEVVAFARTPAKLGLSHPRLTVVQGDVRDVATVEPAVAGADAVIAALSPVRGDPTSNGVMGPAAANIVAAMKKHGVRRLVWTTGQGVPDREHDRPGVMNRVIETALKLLAGDVLAESLQAVDTVRSSGLDWVIVRAPMLTDGPKTGQTKVGWVGQVGRQLRRTNYAEVVLRQVTDNTYLRQMPAVSDG